MGVRLASAQSNVILVVNPGNAVDAALVTTGPLGMIQDNAIIFIHWFLTITTGAGATNYNVRLRRGTTNGGTLINQNTSNGVLASTTVTFAGSYFDTPGAVGTQQYTISGIVTGGAAGITVNDACLMAYIL